MSLFEQFFSLTFLVDVLVAVIAALVLAAVASVIFRLVGRRHEWGNLLVRRTRVPFRFLVLVIGLWIALAFALHPDGIPPQLDFILRALLFASSAWFAASLLYFAEDVGAQRYRIDIRDNRVARRVRTQLRILRRIGVAVLVLCAVAALFLSIPGAAAAGASLFASAGILSLAAGLAAQSTLANVIAGMQLAFNGAIRVDDVVIVEKEWGRIEEITLTYVVVRIWDERHMVLPSTYFTKKPFQNWTRHTAELLGVVEFDLDWRVSPSDMRKELSRILEKTDLWDKRVSVLQVTDAIKGFVRLRVLVTAKDAPTLFDLRCFVRENLVEWVNKEIPEARPIMRVDIGHEKAPSTRPPAVSQEVVKPPGLFTGTVEAEKRHQDFTQPVQLQEPKPHEGTDTAVSSQDDDE